MNKTTKFTTIAATGALLLSTALSPALAAEGAAMPKNTTSEAQQQIAATDEQHQTYEQAAKGDADAVMKVSDEAALSLHAVRAARLAIFDGQTDAAGKMITAALTQMQAAQSDAKTMNLEPKNTTQPGEYVPFDLSMMVGEDFTVTPQNSNDVAKAQAQAQSGETQRAVQTLASADISATLSAALIPTDLAITQLQDAAKSVKSDNWQEANMALKAVEESVVFESWTADSLPMLNAAADQPASSTSNG
ncbi:hypothetical protein BFP70_02915 [Thioclava sp. SK-1]|uniref:YfdX family protein n=1 Tax=Thioclava sp. SK-1 TaxID=1889770 RepID=UPI000824DFA5|nr:YfdX family protein [Thioclava sp. SK-1]OCX67129.1 hypothetical protein BFP70_02915 [Thioclava sp. SK-1]